MKVCSRLGHVKDSSAALPRSRELAAFGAWFASAKFDDIWAITNLLEALKLAGSVEAYDLVIERMVQVAPLKPKLAVECLALMIEGDKEGWHRFSWHQETRAILEAAIVSQDPSARTAAEALVNKLGARDRSYHYLGELVGLHRSEK